MAAHKEQSVQRAINTSGAHVAVIPGGLTCQLQLLDIAVNHSFKCLVRREWEQWMTDGEHAYTPAGRQQRATYVEVCKWVVSAWKQVPVTAICNGFIKAGLVGAPPVASPSDDNALSCEGTGNDSSDEEAEVNQRRITQMMELFDSDNEFNSSFEGFAESEQEAD
jgi:hypothetical protein